MKFQTTNLATFALCLGLASVSHAQNPPADQQKPTDQLVAAPAPAPAGPTTLPTPSITGPIQELPPAVFDAGPFGKVSANGFLSGIGLGQNNSVPGDKSSQVGLSNGQIFLQKAYGVFQFYLQAGIYNIPALGTPFLQSDKAVSNLWGPLPVGFVKLQAGKNTSFEIGALPTLIGAEYTFTFENMNIQRGLLWNQETAVSRGIQVNQTIGKFTASLSWNDGFYSNRYTWLSGSLTYQNGAHMLMFVGGGNYGQTAYQTFATPVQNNGSIYNVIYMYNKGAWIIQPYWQYTNVPTNAKIGITKGASTNSGAILVNHTFKHGFSLPARWEYIASSGSPNDPTVVNLMYGPGSKATSFTVSPTFQYSGFFGRFDVGVVHAMDFAPGSVFGHAGLNENQVRAVAEIGFIFGNNIVEKKP
jgi:hypothetical protein